MSKCGDEIGQRRKAVSVPSLPRVRPRGWSVPTAQREWTSLFVNTPKSESASERLCRGPRAQLHSGGVLEYSAASGLLRGVRPLTNGHWPFFPSNFQLLSCTYLMCQILVPKSWAELFCLWVSLVSPLPDLNLQMNSLSTAHRGHGTKVFLRMAMAA